MEIFLLKCLIAIAVRYGTDTEERQGFTKDNRWYQNILKYLDKLKFSFFIYMFDAFKAMT